MPLTSRLLQSLDEIAPTDWDALHDGRNPFITHAFLHGLETSGSLRTEWGWQPAHVVIHDGDTLVAAAPGYLKGNSHGEFVFDHAWAHAYAQHGLDYYPKWLGAVPYSPVTGPRLLARDDAARSTLLESITALTRANQLSSAHINFHTTDENPTFGEDWLQRLDVQYHWRNFDGWTDFDGFLAAMDHRRRKNIRAERRQVRDASINFRVLHGDEASDEDLAAMHGFYLQTFAEYGNSPALTLEFLHHLACSQPRTLVLILAEHAGKPIAGALCLRGADTLYGRYWGSHVQLPGLHFETCYYQGIDYCLREGLRRFEPGAQGEHKIARGFLPTLTRSRHWLADPRFAAALRSWCADEVASVRQWQQAAMQRSPFKALPP